MCMQNSCCHSLWLFIISSVTSSQKCLLDVNRPDLVNYRFPWHPSLCPNLSWCVTKEAVSIERECTMCSWYLSTWFWVLGYLWSSSIRMLTVSVYFITRYSENVTGLVDRQTSLFSKCWKLPWSINILLANDTLFIFLHSWKWTKKSTQFFISTDKSHWSMMQSKHNSLHWW